MKRNILLIACLMAISAALMGAHCKSTPKDGKPQTKKELMLKMTNADMKPDSVVQKNLGQTACDAIFNAKQINVYKLVGYETIPANSVQVIPHYVRSQKIGEIDKQHGDILKFLLYNETESYKEDELKVRSPFIPLLELEYISKKGKASVVFSFSDFTWIVVSDGKEQFCCNYANKALIRRYFEPFINKINK